MTPKIEWFQEILRQEPSSRVFFPLAKLLCESGDTHQALTTLQKGLEHHSDFLEARLFLIHLLYGIGDMDACSSELLRIADLFNEYPNFWVAWGKAGIQSGGEFGLYMALMSTLVNNPDLTLWEFLSRGLTNLSEKTSGKLSVDNVKHMLKCTGPENIEQSDLSNNLESKVYDDSCTLCTRSMAEILAEQGDISGAIKIYHELEKQAITDEERKSLKEEIVKLSNNVDFDNVDTNSKLFTKDDSIVGLNDKVIGMLEVLAGRLEERARA